MERDDLRGRLDERLEALTAAGVFDPNAHPRGQDGRYITVGGTVQTTNAQGQSVSEGTVERVNPDGSIAVRDNRTQRVQNYPAASIKQAPVARAKIPQSGDRPLPAPSGGGRTTQSHGLVRSAALPSGHQTPQSLAVADARAGRKPNEPTDPVELLAYTQAYKHEKTKIAHEREMQARRDAAAKRRAAAHARAVARHKLAMARHAAVLARRAARLKAAAARKAAGSAPRYVKYSPSSPVTSTRAGKVNLGA